MICLFCLVCPSELLFWRGCHGSSQLRLVEAGRLPSTIIFFFHTSPFIHLAGQYQIRTDEEGGELGGMAVGRMLYGWDVDGYWTTASWY